MKRRALIIGITGQDGTLLSALLSANGFAVDGLPRDFRLDDKKQISEVLQRHYDHVYYLAARHSSSQSPVDEEFAPYHQVNFQGPLNFIESIRDIAPRSRFFYAGSSHMFGKGAGTAFEENSPMRPICYYGLSKYLAHEMIRFFRSEFGLHLSCGILFNHESSLRSPEFLSRKLVLAAEEISRTGKGSLEIGSLEQVVDWGYAPDYVEAMKMMLEKDQGDDYIIASGAPRSVRDLTDAVFKHFGLDYRQYVREKSEIIVNPRGTVLGNPSKANNQLGWKPKHTFEDWVPLICGPQKSG